PHAAGWRTTAFLTHINLRFRPPTSISKKRGRQKSLASLQSAAMCASMTCPKFCLTLASHPASKQSGLQASDPRREPTASLGIERGEISWTICSDDSESGSDDTGVRAGSSFRISRDISRERAHRKGGHMTTAAKSAIGVSPSSIPAGRDVAEAIETLSPPLDDRSRHLRRLVVRGLVGGNRGHVGSSMSLIEILRVLYDHVLRFRSDDPQWADRDRCILSKGHGCLALY